MADQKELSARYRGYCDICQSGQLSRLNEWWALPSLFTVDIGDGKTIHRLIETYPELEKLYSLEFNASSNIDETVIDKEEINFYGPDIATIETVLSHYSNGKLYDQQFALYGCRKVEGKWVFHVHISAAKRSPAQA